MRLVRELNSIKKAQTASAAMMTHTKKTITLVLLLEDKYRGKPAPIEFILTKPTYREIQNLS